MANISRQRQIFEWQELEILGDLERLQLALKYLPDERLMQHLERERDHGRDDYPIRAIWNSILAGVIYLASFCRELKKRAFTQQSVKKSLWAGRR